MDEVIAELKAKIETLKIEGERNVANLIGEYNGRVAELQATVTLLERRQSGEGQVVNTPVVAPSPTGAVAEIVENLAQA